MGISHILLLSKPARLFRQHVRFPPSKFLQRISCGPNRAVNQRQKPQLGFLTFAAADLLNHLYTIYLTHGHTMRHFCRLTALCALGDLDVIIFFPINLITWAFGAHDLLTPQWTQVCCVNRYYRPVMEFLEEIYLSRIDLRAHLVYYAQQNIVRAPRRKSAILAGLTLIFRTLLNFFF